MAAYYLFNLILYRILPSTETKGTVLVTGGRLIYRLNSTYRSACPRAEPVVDKSNSLR